jgi:hypothetical protein
MYYQYVMSYISLARRDSGDFVPLMARCYATAVWPRGRLAAFDFQSDCDIVSARGTEDAERFGRNRIWRS